MKKVGTTTRPFRYDLNQILYDYTVDMRNRFKGLDLIDRVPDELSIPLLCLEGVLDLSGAPKDEAGLTRKFET